MCEIRKKEVDTIIKINSLSRDSVKELNRFWQFCIDKKKCGGANPVALPPRSRRVKAKKGIKKIDKLSLAQFDYACKMLSDNPTGPNMGLLLMLGGGYTNKQVLGFTFADLEIINRVENYVLVKVLDLDCAGATHDKSKPLIPSAARGIIARYDSMLDMYEKSTVLNMPIVSTVNDPFVALTQNALNDRARQFLEKILLQQSSTIFYLTKIWILRLRM